MKRNQPPSGDDNLIEEQEIINERLDELFSCSPTQQRKIPISNKGVWLRERRHVRIDSTKGVAAELLAFSHEFRYYFLNPFEALYCLETNQLLIYFNGLPLSLAEAYHLLLNDSVHKSRNYNVFRQLNRSGYICLKPSREDLEIAFEVFRRDTYDKNKPRKGKQGNPDYLLIVSDKPPSCKQLLQFRSASDKHEELSEEKLLFASVDDDTSICFIQFNPLN